MTAYLVDISFLVELLGAETVRGIPSPYIRKVDISGAEYLEEVEQEIAYDSSKARLTCGTQSVDINGPLERGFLEEMFAHESGELVSWDLISERVNGDKDDFGTYHTEKVRNGLKDAKLRLNRKIESVFGISDYFSSHNGEYRRK